MEGLGILLWRVYVFTDGFCRHRRIVRRLIVLLWREGLWGNGPEDSMTGLDGGGVCAVAKSEDGRKDEKGFDAEDFPYPSSEECDEDGDGMVDGDSGGDCGLHLLPAVGYVLDIYV